MEHLPRAGGPDGVTVTGVHTEERLSYVRCVPGKSQGNTVSFKIIFLQNYSKIVLLCPGRCGPVIRVSGPKGVGFDSRSSAHTWVAG